MKWLLLVFVLHISASGNMQLAETLEIEIESAALCEQAKIVFRVDESNIPKNAQPVLRYTTKCVQVRE